MTMHSKESGTNVSYQSNYSAIQNNIMRFKNKRNTVQYSKIVIKEGVKGIKMGDRDPN
jgi:hypothetical protein